MFDPKLSPESASTDRNRLLDGTDYPDKKNYLKSTEPYKGKVATLPPSYRNQGKNTKSPVQKKKSSDEGKEQEVDMNEEFLRLKEGTYKNKKVDPSQFAPKNTPSQAPVQKKGAPDFLKGQGTTSTHATPKKFPDFLRTNMEGAFGQDFSNVKFSESTKASTLGAQAYTQGSAIQFAPGKFQPHTREGQELIGHELSHVVQQRQGRVQPNTQTKGVPVNDDPKLEREADEMGKKAVAQRAVDPGFFLSPGTTIAKAPALQMKEGQEELDKIAPQQMVYEFAAHNLVYRAENSALTDEDKDFLENNGYEPKLIQWYGKQNGGKLGFQAVLIPSFDDSKNDILAIRGTVPGGGSEELMTIFVDLDPRAVGGQQFIANEKLIAQALADADGAVDVTGHSLGGAMAQHVAVNFSGSVANVATFQSPGIDQASVDTFMKIPEEERPNAVHHIVTGDIVDKAGEASLPGMVFEHNFGKELDVNTMLSTLRNYIRDIKSNIGRFGIASASVVTHVAGESLEKVINPFGSFDTVELDDRIKKLSTIKNTISNDVSGLKKYIGEVTGGIGDAHGTHVFSSEHYETLREQRQYDDTIFGKDFPLNRESEVESHEIYPHKDQREVAEPVRQNAGKYLQPILAGVIQLVKAYETIVAAYKRFKQGVKNAWEGVKEFASGTVEKAKKLVQKAWDAISSLWK